ncbi:MAG: twin-arginine translocase subunit TatC [Prevotellaceae bacterium]|nr:twin-arginine translocase subunit TatC [Prevotellaceae bacterium]
MSAEGDGFMTFGGHLEVLRRMLIRIIAVITVIALVVFCFKDETFALLLAPSKSDFITYRWIENACNYFGIDFHFEAYAVKLIAVELSSQFMTHVTTSFYLALLAASPYILYELFRFVSPALYENERRYSARTIVTIYVLFVIGVLMTYFVLFPISFRFLGTYQVSDAVVNNITLDSYIGTLTTLTLLMAVIFQLPVISFFLAKMGIITSSMLAKYRRHAFILIMIVAAIITPPDIMTLILVTVPMYMLYEMSILIIKKVE